MFASFHSNGTTPSFNDKLNTLASGILKVAFEDLEVNSYTP